MSYGTAPRTETMYCPRRACVHSYGIEVKWAPDADDGPGFPYTDSCPACGADLSTDPHPSDDTEWTTEEPE